MAALVVLVTVIFVIGFQGFLAVQPKADLDVHIAYAERIQTPADITSPHFLFQLLLKAVHAVGVGYVTGAAWLLGLCYGGMALLIARELGRRGGRITTLRMCLVIPALLIASHVFLLTASRPNLYYGYFVPVVYHNATQQLNKLFALWICFTYSKRMLEDEAPTLRTAPAMAALCVLSALAKPSFLVAFLPTSGLYALQHALQRRWHHVLVFVAAIAIPSVAVLLWQSRMAYGGDGNAVVFAPFVVFSLEATLYKLPASLLFPLTVAVVAKGGWGPAVSLRFTWLFTAVALFATLGLAESGDMMAGNFAWTGQTAVFLAYVESALFLLTAPSRRPLAWVVFTLHVVCGIVWYAVGFWPERPLWL